MNFWKVAKILKLKKKLIFSPKILKTHIYMFSDTEFSNFISEMLKNSPNIVFLHIGWQTSSGVIPFLLHTLTAAPQEIRSYKLFFISFEVNI